MSTATNSNIRFHFQVKVNRILIRILINSRLSRDLIKPKFIEKYRIPIKKKSKLYRLYNFNNTLIRKVNSYTKLLNLKIG